MNLLEIVQRIKLIEEDLAKYNSMAHQLTGRLQEAMHWKELIEQKELQVNGNIDNKETQQITKK